MLGTMTKVTDRGGAHVACCSIRLCRQQGASPQPMTSPEADTIDDARPRKLSPALLRITAVVTFGPFLAQLDTTLMNIALPTLGQTFDTPLSTVQWVTTGYLLALALMIPLCGWLVDRFGPKQVYIGCFSIFTVASVLCGFAGSIGMLVACRVLQGMAGGLLAPMAQLMAARYAGPQMARMLSLVGMPVLFAPIFGPFVGGSIIHLLSWRGLFFINLPLGVLAIAAAVRLLPGDTDRRERTLDWQGFLLLSPGLVILLYSFEHAATGADILFGFAGIGLGLLMLATFVVWTLKGKGAGLLDLGLFRIRIFSTAAVTQFLANAITQGGQMLLSLYVLTIMALPPASAGLLLAAMGGGLFASRIVIAWMLDWMGPRALSASGAAFCLVATLPFLIPGFALPMPAIVVALFVRGFGAGIVNMPSVVSAYASVDRSALSDAATALNIAQRLGGPVATMALTLCLTSQIGPWLHLAGSGASTSFAMAFSALVAINILCFAAALQLPRRIRRR